DPERLIMAHRIVLAAPGGGKSETLKLWILRWALQNDRTIVVDDWHGGMWVSLIGHLVANGLEPRLVIERAQWTDRILGWNFTVPAMDGDPERRKIANRLRQQWWLQPT